MPLVNKSFTPGTLSVFPTQRDSTANLHFAVNKAQDTLRQTLAVNGKYVVLNDATKFPDSGIIKITPSTSDNLLDHFEVIYYGKKVGNQLHFLHRGYSNSTPNTWAAGSKVSCPLMAEHHNAIKDAIQQIQKKIGLGKSPSSDSINGILTYLENKWLAPKPSFKAYPRTGVPPLTVTFHNFSNGFEGRYLWDFGDGTTSSEKNPIHTYHSEGSYTVRLTMITNTSQGLTEKKDYIEVTNEQLASYFYVTPFQGKAKETVFTLVDQSEGDIIERHWFFGDGKDLTVTNANLHSVAHTYEDAGSYLPSLILRLADNKTRRVFFSEGIEVYE